MTITNLNDSLYYIFVMYVAPKSTFVETMYNQKISDSSHVCRGLHSIEEVGHDWVVAVGAVQNTSTWLECRLYL